MGESGGGSAADDDGGGGGGTAAAAVVVAGTMAGAANGAGSSFCFSLALADPDAAAVVAVAAAAAAAATPSEARVVRVDARNSAKGSVVWIRFRAFVPKLLATGATVKGTLLPERSVGEDGPDVPGSLDASADATPL